MKANTTHPREQVIEALRLKYTAKTANRRTERTLRALAGPRSDAKAVGYATSEDFSEALLASDCDFERRMTVLASACCVFVAFAAWWRS